MKERKKKERIREGMNRETNNKVLQGLEDSTGLSQVSQSSKGNYMIESFFCSISNWSPKIGEGAVRTELHQAFAAWAKYGRLKFQETTSPDADIIVAFGSSWHGDA